MLKTFPGTTVEAHSLEKGSSRSLFDGIFATGGITLSQVSIMTGLEPYIIQNWVKRGFVSSPKNRVYRREQFARIILINMLREIIQLERICDLIRIIGGDPNDRSDDLISDDELYHLYVDMIAQSNINAANESEVQDAAQKAAREMNFTDRASEKTLARILEVMLYAHRASCLASSAENILASLN